MTLTELLFYIDYIDCERYCEEYIDIPDKEVRCNITDSDIEFIITNPYSLTEKAIIIYTPYSSSELENTMDNYLESVCDDIEKQYKEICKQREYEKLRKEFES